MKRNSRNNLFSVHDKIVIITGGSGKLGTVYINHLLNEGARVCNYDITPSKDKYSKFPDSYKFLETDITDKSSLKHSLRNTIKILGNPDALINNAALDSPPGTQSEINGPFEKYPEEAWDEVINVNLKGVFLTCQVIGDNMAKQNGGSIINISSHYGLRSPDNRIYQYENDSFYKPIAYSASKSGIFNLTRYISTYWGKKNVRVNTLTLGGVFNNQDERFVKNYSEKVPLDRMASEDEYCGAIQFLISSASSYMTGANLVIDGGWTAW